MEIGVREFWSHKSDIEEAINSASFISLDLELSGLSSDPNIKYSLFDSGCERYAKLRRASAGILATQVGLSAFKYNRDSHSYTSSTYTFHLCPQSVGGVQQFCTFEGSVFGFLKSHKFDFNKFAYEGIPYLNKNEIFHLEKNLKENDMDSDIMRAEIEIFMQILKKIQNWLSENSKDSLILSENSHFIPYVAYKINQIHPNLEITLKHSEIEFKRPATNCDILNNRKQLHDEVLKYAMGFTNIINLLKEKQIPIILHNAFYDLVIIYKQFIETLPLSYDSFKNNINRIFPDIYDSKHVFNEIRSSFKKDLLADVSSLSNLYSFFNEPRTKCINIHVPKIIMKENFDSTPWFHHAGWDAFCTGYCFIHIAHFITGTKNQEFKISTNTELFSYANKYCNCIYFSRGAQPYLCLDKNDPARHRPQYLHIKLLNNQDVNIHQIANKIGKFDSIDVKKYGNKSVLVAVMNNYSIRRIMDNFKQNDDMIISKFNIFKHSPVIRMALWSSLILSSTGLLGLYIFNVSK